MHFTKLLPAFFLLTLSINGLSQNLLGSYNFTGLAGNEAQGPADAQPTNGSLSAVTRGSGITPSVGANSFSATGFTTATSVNLQQYFELSAGANAGFSLSLDSIVFGERR
jgi:hypothetical protein